VGRCANGRREAALTCSPLPSAPPSPLHTHPHHHPHQQHHLEDMIAARREAADRREAIIAREVAALVGEGSGVVGGAGIGGSMHAAAAGSTDGSAAAAAPGGQVGGGGHSAVLNAGSGGPVQMSSANTELVADIEKLIRATQSTAGQQVGVLEIGGGGGGALQQCSAQRSADSTHANPIHPSPPEYTPTRPPTSQHLHPTRPHRSPSSSRAT